MILILKHKWFDMIAAGSKREEYRAHCKRYLDMADRLLRLQPQDRVIEFRRGYTRTAMRLSVVNIGIAECVVTRSLLREQGMHLLEEWGFDKSRKTIVFQLGRKVG